MCCNVADVLAAAAVSRVAIVQYVCHVCTSVCIGPTMSQSADETDSIPRKLFLGGYKHKETGVEYHHAATQTISVNNKPKEHVLKFHRDTQTATTETRSTQNVREQFAQTKRQDVYIDERTDREMEVRPYMSADEVIDLREAKATIVQNYVRGWFSRRRARKLRELIIAKRDRIIQERQRRKEEEEARRQHEVDRRMNPQTVDDFNILYRELEAWNVQETRRIKSSELDRAEKQEALKKLLDNQTKLIQHIDRLRHAAMKRMQETNVASKLNHMAKPKVIKTQDQAQNVVTTEVHTPFTTRARELMELYSGLKMTSLTIDERLDVLLHVKWTVKEFDCNLTRELVDLIDREADMLNRGRSEKALVGLRKRIATLFLQFVETPEFNPEAGRFQKVPRQYLNHPDVKPIPSKS